MFAALVAELRSKGFVLPDEIVANQHFEFLGTVLNGTSGRLRCTARQCWRLWYALTEVLQIRLATGDALRVLGGGGLPGAPLTHTLLFELRLSRALLIVTGSNFWRDLRETVFCFDYRRERTPFSSHLLVCGKRKNSVGGRNAGGSER